jgi:hypothetical protein
MVKKVKSEHKLNSTDLEHKMDLYFQEESAGNISGKIEIHPEPTPAETPTEIQVGNTLGDWNCPQCTLVNEPRNRFCSACGFQNKSFPSKKRKKREPEETSDLKENTLKNTDEITPRQDSSDVNLDVRSPDGPQLLDPASIPVGASWLCPQCTCENEYKNRYCVACSYYFRRIAKPNLMKANRKSDPKGDLDHSAGKSIEMEEESEQPDEPAFKVDENAEEWHCPQCTFENPIRNRYCDACRFDRRPPSSQQKKKRLSLEPPAAVVTQEKATVASASSRKSIEPEESKSNSASKKRTPSKTKSSSEIPLTPTPKSPLRPIPATTAAAAAAALSSPLPALPSPQKKTKKVVVPTEKESTKPAEPVVVPEGKKGKSAETRSVVIEEPPSSSLPFFPARETRSANKTILLTQPSIIPPAQLKAEERAKEKEKEKEKQPFTPVKTLSRPPRTKKNATSVVSTTTNGDDQDTPLLSKKRTVSSSQSTERLEDSENDTDRQEENDEMMRMKRINNSLNNNNNNNNNSSQWECPSCQYKNRKDFVHCFRCHLPNKSTAQTTSSQAKGNHQKKQQQSNKAQEVGDISRKIFGTPPESQSSVVPVKKEGKNKKKNEKKRSREAKKKEVSTVSTSPMSNNPFAPMMNPLMMTDPLLFQQLLSSSSAPTNANSTSSTDANTAPFLMNPFLAFPFMNPFLQLTSQPGLPNTAATVNPLANNSPLFVSPSLLPHQSQVPPARPAILRSASAESSNSSFRINSDFNNLQQNNQQINNNVNNTISRNTTTAAAGALNSNNNDPTLLLAQALLGNNAADVLGSGANLNENLLQAYQRYLSSLQQQYQTTTTNWTQPRTAPSSAANKNGLGPAAAASSSHKNDEVSGFLVIKSEGSCLTDLVNDCASDLTTSSATADGESSQQKHHHHQLTDPPSVQEEAYHYLSNNGGIREKTFKPIIGSNSQAEIPPLNVEEDPYDYYWKPEKNSDSNNNNRKKYQENNEYYEVIWLSNSELLDIPDDLEPTVDVNRPKRRTRTTFTTYPWDELPAKSPKTKEDKIVTLNDFAERFSDNQVTALHSLWKSSYCYDTALKEMERLEEEKKHYKHDVSLLILNKEERERFKKAISRYGNDDWNHVAVSFLFLIWFFVL